MKKASGNDNGIGLILTFAPFYFHFSAHEALKHLREIADVIEPKSTNREDFIKECQSGQLDGIFAAMRTFESVNITGLVDEELVKVLPKSLKFLCHNGQCLYLQTKTAPGKQQLSHLR